MIVARGSASRIALAGGEGQGRVLLRIGLGTPEVAVGLVPDFPKHMPPLEVLGRGRRPARERRDAGGVLRRGRGLMRFAGDRIGTGYRLLVKRCE